MGSVFLKGGFFSFESKLILESTKAKESSISSGIMMLSPFVCFIKLSMMGTCSSLNRLCCIVSLNTMSTLVFISYLVASSQTMSLIWFWNSSWFKMCFTFSMLFLFISNNVTCTSCSVYLESNGSINVAKDPVPAYRICMGLFVVGHRFSTILNSPFMNCFVLQASSKHMAAHVVPMAIPESVCMSCLFSYVFWFYNELVTIPKIQLRWNVRLTIVLDCFQSWRRYEFLWGRSIHWESIFLFKNL